MEGKIYIIGHIGDIDGIIGVTLIDVLSQVKNQETATSFTVYIDSPGGEVEVGESIYKYLKALKIPVKTVGSNMVASIATVIFMAGDTRVINEGCEFMIHLPMGGIDYATADELENYSKVIKNIENRMIKFYSDVTGMEREAVEPLLKNETWLTPEQLKSFGFITGDTPLKITAKARVSKFNTNKKNRKMAKSKKTKNKFWAKMEALLDDFSKAGKATNLILLAADQTEVDFFELEEGTDISEGARARIDGKDAEGEITMADGRVITFEAGAVKTIVEASGGDDDDMDLEEAMQAIEDLEADKAEDALEIKALKKELKAKNKIVARIKKVQSKFDDKGGKDRQGGRKGKKNKKKSDFAQAMSNIPKN